MTMHFKTVLLTIGVLLGIVVGEKFNFGSEIAVAFLIFILTQLVVVGVGKWRDAVGTAPPLTPLLFILFSLGLFIGIIRVQLVEEKTNYICEASCTFEAEIISSPEPKNDYQVFNVHPVGVYENILDIQVKTPLYPKYKIGETLKLSGKVSEPENIYAHDGKKFFDYSSYLLTKNVGSVMFYPKVEVTNEETDSTVAVLGRWKENMIEKINLYISSPASTLASGMLFGNSGIEKELTQTFRVAGLSHIVVLSGFNIAIVISFILFVFAFLPLFIRIALASTSVIFFVMMVGGEASVIRATLMAFVALLATLLGREYVAKQALIISLLLIVLYEPYSLLNDVSLHLSFLATAGIIYLSSPLSEIIKKYFLKIKSENFLSLVTTTSSAYLATLPYVMYTFGTVSVYALIANILVLPFVPITMLISFLVVSSSYANTTIATLLGFVDTLILNFIIWVGRVIEYLPFSYLTFQITFVEMLVVYSFIIVGLIYFITKNSDETKSTTVDGFLTDTISY